MVDYTKKWKVMLAVAMGLFLATIDGSIVNIALPTLEKYFNEVFSTVEWVVLGYLLTITTLMLSIGRLADMVGKKKIFLWGLVIFTAGSILCGLSTSVGMLIGFRVFQAFGAAMMMALSSAIITEAFPPDERGKALGINGLIVSIGIITGPTIGGLILDSLEWHWLFFVNFPIGVAGVFLVIKYVPELSGTRNQRFDFLGSGLIFFSLLAFLLALTVGQRVGFINPWVIFSLVTWLVLLAVFVVIENKEKFPLIDLSLFKSPLLSINLLTGYMTFIASAGTTILMPFYLTNILGFSPRPAGLLLAVVPLSVGIVAPFAGALSDKVGPRILTAAGLAILVFGYWSISQLSLATTSLEYALRFLPVGIGLGFFQSPNNSAVMGAAPKNRLGVVSGMLAITRTLGQTTGIAILGALWAARVSFYSGGEPLESATKASASAQVAGLQDSLTALIFLLLFAFFLSLWAVVKERRQLVLN